jgi:hypothetical protein
MARGAGAALAVAAPLLLVAAASVGLHGAAERAALRAEAEKNRLRAEAERRLAEKREAERRQRNARKADRLTEEMDGAMKESRWRDAHRIYLEIQALNPEHGSLRRTWAQLGPELDALRESERQRAVASGIRQARRTVKDRVICESARAVSGAWGQLRQARPGDEEWSGAVKAVERLERCRQRVEKIFNQNAVALRVQARTEFVRAARLELQKMGYAPRVRLGGRNRQEAKVTIADMLDEDAARITANGSRQPGALLHRAQRLGFGRLVLSNGTGKTWTYALEPEDESRIGATVLKKFGLDRPLQLQAPAPELPADG